MYDTIAAIVKLDRVDKLPSSAFTGGTVTEDFDSGRHAARLWRNPGDTYEPRVTYWPDGDRLKVEFSVSKMVRVTNPTQADAEFALDLVNEFLVQHFGFQSLVDVRSWKCQRIDYAWTFDVDPARYLTMLSGLQVGTMTRQEHRGSGVVWKAGNRWVKFYDKALDGAPGLRFEVSNYRDAVRYMCKRWFLCAQTVRNLVDPGRAAYVLAWTWHMLGLDQDEYRSASATLFNMRDLYGSSVATAFYHLTLLKDYGRDAVDLDLTNASSYSKWKKRLSDDGFVVQSSNDLAVVDASLTPLRLPITTMIEQARNLERQVPPGGTKAASKNSEIFGAPGARDLPILERYYAI